MRSVEYMYILCPSVVVSMYPKAVYCRVLHLVLFSDIQDHVIVVNVVFRVM